LSRPLPALSFEFTNEFLDNAGLCIGRVQELRVSRFNFVSGEGRELELPEWTTGNALVTHLGNSNDASLWGDVFAQHTA